MEKVIPTGAKRKCSYLSESEFEYSNKFPQITKKFISIAEAKDFIRLEFQTLRVLLNEKETELISELRQLEKINKPIVTQVTADIKQLYATIESLDSSLSANSMHTSIQQQKSICDIQKLYLESYQKLLSSITLKSCDTKYLCDNIVEFIPLWSKSKFQTELEPILKLKPKINEEWFVVSNQWFRKFGNSINLHNHQANDYSEFPVAIPIDHSGIYTNGIINPDDCQLLHPKAWDLLQNFNGLSPGSSPIKRPTYLKGGVVVPLNANKLTFIIGHTSNKAKFSLQCEFETFPYHTYQDVLQRLSGFCTLFTTYNPELYYTDYYSTITCNPGVTEYTGFTYLGRGNGFNPINDLTLFIGDEVKYLVMIIPDASGTRSTLDLSKKRLQFKSK